MVRLYGLLICLFFNILFSSDAVDSSSVVESYETIPNVKLKNLDKKKFKLLEVCKDSYVLFNFWNVC